jgi:hypothetical protein
MTKLHLKATRNVYIRKNTPSTQRNNIKGVIYKDQEFDLDANIIYDARCEKVDKGKRK